MVNVQDLRAGTTFLLDGQPWVCLRYEHIKMGRGSATIRVKVRNLLTGAITEKSFVNSARVEEIDTGRRPMTFLYRQGETGIFMDTKTFEQIEISVQVLASSVQFLREGAVVDVLFWEDKPLAVELPPKMEFMVVETDPGIKGNSAANMYKKAVLNNGLTIRVPLFIAEGDKILVDTRDGSYVERVKNSV